MGKKIAFIDLGHIRGRMAVEAQEPNLVRAWLGALAEKNYRHFADGEGARRDFPRIITASWGNPSAEALA